MTKTTAGTLLLLGVLAACSKKPPSPDEGMGAGAVPPPAMDTALAPVPSAAPVPVAPPPAPDTTRRPTAVKRAPVVTDQTQSGVTDATTGSSTLGPNMRTARPDQGQAVTAKGDVLVARWDSAAGGWTHHRLGDTTTGPLKGDSALQRTIGDTTRKP